MEQLLPIRLMGPFIYSSIAQLAHTAVQSYQMSSSLEILNSLLHVA